MCSAEVIAEVCVIGGGPAGAAAAIRLARLGHAVVLVDRGQPAREHTVESLPGSVLPLLEMLGVRERVERAGFARLRGTVVNWHGIQNEANAGGDEAGWLVDRSRFDALLRQAAEEAGVRIWCPASASAPTRSGERWLVPLRDGRHLDAAMLVDARGRRHAEASGVRTAALWATWRGDARPEARAHVEAGTSSWAWAAPRTDGAIDVAVFVDAARCAGLDADRRITLYRSLLAEAPMISAVLSAHRPGPVQTCDATPTCVDDAAPEPGLLRVGEAAFSIDPLSSQGVPAALRGGWQAAACVHTALARPADAALAWSFHRDQVRRAARRHESLTARFYAAAALTSSDPFWSSRASAARNAPDTRPWPDLDQRLTLSATARWRRMPVLEGDWIVARDALEHDTLDAPLAFLADHPLRDWLAPLRIEPPLRDLLDRWRDAFGEARTRAAWPVLWRHGVVVAAVASRRSTR